MMAPLSGRGAVLAGMLVAAVALGGCAPRVTRKDFDAEVARLREEMKTSDQNVATRIDSTNAKASDHDRRLAALEQELQQFRQEYNVSIEKMKGALKFNVPVHFEFGGSELREQDRPVLDRFAQVVKENYPDAVITVEGFTDPAGSTRYNLWLGEQRATAVRDYLGSTGGLPGDKLKAVSYGETRIRQVIPGAKGPGDTGLENRRVALVIDYANTGSTVAELP